MSGTSGGYVPDRKEAEVRRMLDGPYPLVPPDLAARAAEQGRRIMARRRAVRIVLWTVLLVAAAAFAVWAAIAKPWIAPPTDTTPPLDGW
jgi:ferric-dicitrate binding protein FerR (iron transport regulator)